MTDNEIIKALEQCSNCKSISNCKGCPIGVSECFGDAVVLSHPVFEKALDLINHQKAEIERLTAERDSMHQDVKTAEEYAFKLKTEIERLNDNLINKCIYLSDDETTEFCVNGPCPEFKTEKQIKAEAAKEFAERLKEYREIVGYDRDFDADIYGSHIRIDIDEFNNLVKEMVGEG